MANASDHPLPVRCPRCALPEALEYPGGGDEEAFFCRDCGGFRLSPDHRFLLAAVRTAHPGRAPGDPVGRLVVEAAGARRLLPD